MYYLFEDIPGDDNTHYLYSPDCKVNGVGGYQPVIQYYDAMIAVEKDIIRIGVFDHDDTSYTTPVYYWYHEGFANSLVNWKRLQWEN